MIHFSHVPNKIVSVQRHAAQAASQNSSATRRDCHLRCKLVCTMPRKASFLDISVQLSLEAFSCKLPIKRFFCIFVFFRFIVSPSDAMDLIDAHRRGGGISHVLTPEKGREGKWRKWEGFCFIWEIGELTAWTSASPNNRMAPHFQTATYYGPCIVAVKCWHA